MKTQEFFEQLHARIAPFDLLCHPFYKAWSAGELSRDDLREYARDYYHHVNAFPAISPNSACVSKRANCGAPYWLIWPTKRAADDTSGNSREHAELWLDFAEGMGASRNLRGHKPVAEVIICWLSFTTSPARDRRKKPWHRSTPTNRRSRVAIRGNTRGLREMYGADGKNLRLFHAAQHCGCLPLTDLATATGSTGLEQNPQAAEPALSAGGKAAKASVDGAGRDRGAEDGARRAKSVAPGSALTAPLTGIKINGSLLWKDSFDYGESNAHRSAWRSRANCRIEAYPGGT